MIFDVVIWSWSWAKVQGHKMKNVFSHYGCMLRGDTSKHTCIPLPGDSILRTYQLTVLEVTCNNTLFSVIMYKNVTAKAASCLYALKKLKAYGLQGKATWGDTQAILFVQVAYSSPSWRGFMKSDDTSKLKAKARRYGYALAFHKFSFP